MEHIRDIYERLARIEDKIDTLTEFKISTIVTTRTVALIVSSLCGLITMIATTLVNYYKLKQ